MPCPGHWTQLSYAPARSSVVVRTGSQLGQEGGKVAVGRARGDCAHIAPAHLRPRGPAQDAALLVPVELLLLPERAGAAALIPARRAVCAPRQPERIRSGAAVYREGARLRSDKPSPHGSQSQRRGEAAAHLSRLSLCVAGRDARDEWSPRRQGAATPRVPPCRRPRPPSTAAARARAPSRRHALTPSRAPHPVQSQVELLVLGGTWASYPHAYQEEFCRDLFYGTPGPAAPTRD